MAIYRNRTILNQRGGSIDIDNTTEQEKFKISHRSGSNLNFTNVVTSELATTNKQINVINDFFETTLNDKSISIGGILTTRTGENVYNLKGFHDLDQFDKFQEWKSSYQPISLKNSQFKIKRGGVGYPNGTLTTQEGSRDENPVIKQSVYTVDNTFHGYTRLPEVNSSNDEVASYITVIDRGQTFPAQSKKITVEDVSFAAGESGSNAPGVLEHGPEKSAATEGGDWSTNDDADVEQDLIDLQETLNEIEQQMGNGGDEINLIKRDKFEQVGVVFNDFASVKIDPEGRSQPFEMLVAPTGTFLNHDYIPHVEAVDNSANFPGGNDDKVVCNKYTRTVGSGGISFKTTGSFEVGGTVLAAGFKAIHLNASHGISIASEASVEIQSYKTITLRTNRQVLVESSLGVKNNIVAGGGLYVEGELYCNHITAPLEVHETQDTIVLGKFNTDTDRSLPIGEVNVDGAWYPVYALSTDNLLRSYPHSHHHHGPAMRLTTSNNDLRTIAGQEGMNSHGEIVQSLPQYHERKLGVSYLL